MSNMIDGLFVSEDVEGDAAVHAYLDKFNEQAGLKLNAGRPDGFYRVQTISGEPAGLGFFCHKCHLGIVSDAPDRVAHCGTASEVPKGFFAVLKRARLPLYRIPAYRGL